MRRMSTVEYFEQQSHLTCVKSVLLPCKMVDLRGGKTLRGSGLEIMASLLEILTTMLGFFISWSFTSVSHLEFRNLENFRGVFDLNTILHDLFERSTEP